jgi:hypothetical protein
VGTSSPNFESGTGQGIQVNYSGGLGAHIKLTDSASGSGATDGFDLYAYNTNGYIENYEAGAIIFRNNGSEQMRLTSTGLGIGTSSPINKLQVAGAVAATGGAGGYAANMALLDVSGGNAQITAIGANTSTVGTLVFQAFSSNSSLGGERARIDSSGNLGIGLTSPSARLHVRGASGTYTGGIIAQDATGNFFTFYGNGSDGVIGTAGNIRFASFDGSSERARIDSSGNLLVGKTTSNSLATAGVQMFGGGDAGAVYLTRNNSDILSINRLASDGLLVVFYQDTTQEGNISVSGTTVSYNGGHLSRYAQTTTAKDDSLLKGTVLSNLDEMSVYTKDGQPVANEQLNKVKVSDTEGDVNVAGVFVNWSHDKDHNVDEINMAMTGDMIIRIAQGVTVVRGDLLMSAGDGTAKPQGDDIIRSKTVAKVTSNHVTCTYADGSYCVPCVLMAC